MRKQLPVLVAALAAAGHAHATLENLRDFNPAVSVIFDGAYYHDNVGGDGGALLDDHASALYSDIGADEEEGLSQGFNLRETELALSGSVDPYFDAGVNASLGTDSIAIEEAWFRSRNLPHGLQLKVGKFLSAIGLHNEKHAHTWEFADQNLAYLDLIGGEGLSDTGMQLTWLAPTDTYLQTGLEILQGDGLERFGMTADPASAVETLAADGYSVTVDELGLKTNDGPNLGVAFVRLAPDLGTNSALQLGLSAAHHRHQQALLNDGTDDLISEGAANLYGVQALYKRFATGDYGLGAVALQSEYFYLDSKQKAVWHGNTALTGVPVTVQQQAGYVQASYGFAPRWQVAARYAVAGVGAQLNIDNRHHDVGISRQNSVVVSWAGTEFSRVRLQFSRNDIATTDGHQDFNQVLLQYNLSLGAHGAHTF